MYMNNEPFAFVLYGNPVTKKNSPVMVKGRSVLLPSEAYRKYESSCRKALQVLKVQEKLRHFSMGVSMCCIYHLENKAHYPDLLGLLQATADIISDEYKTINYKKTLYTKWVLSDDRIIKNFDGSKIAEVNSLQPRVVVIITPLSTTIDTETDPYIIKQLQKENNLFKEHKNG